ncbi:DAK2 domain fusion protein YloV, partial [Brevibacterium paucivorans]
MAARWAQQAVERLRRQRGSIDSINVFPVADGDTGSNMYATVKSAYRAVEAIDGPATLPRVVEAMAAGALRGARGNSGLILAVALRGVADELGEAALAEGDLT